MLPTLGCILEMHFKRHARLQRWITDSEHTFFRAIENFESHGKVATLLIRHISLETAKKIIVLPI
jgi:hypothetical protein